MQGLAEGVVTVAVAEATERAAGVGNCSMRTVFPSRALPYRPLELPKRIDTPSPRPARQTVRCYAIDCALDLLNESVQVTQLEEAVVE